MKIKNFRLNCIIRVLGIAANIIICFYTYQNYKLHATVAILCLLAIYQVYALIVYIEKTNRDLSRFFTAIKYSDFSQSFSSQGQGGSFSELNNAFNNVIKEFQKARTEKEANFRYLQTVVQHISIGLIVFKQDGEVDLINKAAKRLFNLKTLHNIKNLSAINEKLVETLLKLRPSERTLFKFPCNDEILQLAVYATEFTLHGQSYKLVTLQNIRSELEEKEMEAWQNLIRVLTHEIMNSVTPISSLASTATSLLDEALASCEDNDAETITDIQNAVQTIKKRSQSLLQFVENYRQLTRIPKPNFSIIPISDLFERIYRLLQKEIEEQGIILTTEIDPPSLELTADPILIEQVLINLIKNAVQALSGHKDGQLRLKADMDGRGRVIIQVIDNGPGIQTDVLEKIFIPFFTTKRDGSGIGLSLAKQIMRLHRANISVQSIIDRETVFTLRF